MCSLLSNKDDLIVCLFVSPMFALKSIIILTSFRGYFFSQQNTFCLHEALFLLLLLKISIISSFTYTVLAILETEETKQREIFLKDNFL